MKLHNDRNAQLLAEAANTTIENFQEIFLNALFSLEIVFDDEYLCGQKFKDVCENCTTIKDLFDALKQSGIESIRPEHYNALMNVVFIGDGDCPECGGEMEIIESEEIRCIWNDYDCPPEYEFEITKRCPICGKIIITNEYC